MKKFIVALIAAAALAFPALAMADQPDGSFVYNTNQNANGHANCSIGWESAQIIQNGQFVSGNNTEGYDQTSYPGQRADIVHEHCP